MSGIGEPQPGEGNIGDFYMDEFGRKIYEKKSSGWILITQIAESEKTYAYYSDLASAVSVVNNELFDDNSLMVDKNEARVGIYIENNIPYVVLFEDASFSEKITINKDMVLKLNARTLSFNSSVGLEINTNNVTIDAEDLGSKITISSNEVSSNAIKVDSGKCVVLGGEITSNSNALGTAEDSNACILVENLADLSMKGTKIVAADETNGTISAIMVKRGGEAYLSNINVEAVSPYGLNVTTILNEGETTAVNSIFVAKANYTANEAHTDYASNSRGLYNFGIIKLKDCNVLGTHSGMTTRGVAYVDGGIFGGYSHGGIYFSGGQTESYVKNASIKQIPMFEGFYDDGIAGTNQAGMYVGGANNIIVYMDNCEFTGNYYPFVMKKSCSNNKLYISNSVATEGFTKYIRLDTTSNTLYIGKGNNFSADTCYQEGAAIETEEDYLINFIIEDVAG